MGAAGLMRVVSLVLLPEAGLYHPAENTRKPQWREKEKDKGEERRRLELLLVMRTLRLEQQPLLLITIITATGQLETTLSSLTQQHTGKISLLLPFRSLPDNEKSYAAAANHSLETTRRAKGRVSVTRNRTS